MEKKDPSSVFILPKARNIFRVLALVLPFQITSHRLLPLFPFFLPRQVNVTSHFAEQNPPPPPLLVSHLREYTQLANGDKKAAVDAATPSAEFSVRAHTPSLPFLLFFVNFTAVT